jgi:ABC-2 type transport system permease protein
VSRTATALRMQLREYRRTPILLEVLVGAPADAIVLFALVVPATEITFQLAAGGTVTAGLAALTTLWMAPLVGALVGGITGLFVMRMTRDADERLVVAGYCPRQVVLARLGLLGAVGVLATVVATIALLGMGVLVTKFTPALLGWFALATLLATLIYGMVGVVVGTVLDTLAGIYFLLFVPMLDLFLYQNPLATETAAVGTYLPGHFPVQLAMDAAFTESVSVEPLAWSLVWLAVLTVLATAAFSRSLPLRTARPT